LDAYLDSFEDFKLIVRELSFSAQDKEIIKGFQTRIKNLGTDEISKDRVFSIVEDILDKSGLGKGKVYKPLRLSCSARASGPDLFTFLAILDRESILERMAHVLEHCCQE
ncbi:hypothetical protein ACFLZV_07165, partial [Candidatus Margulisiibacteriota bacterium]